MTSSLLQQAHRILEVSDKKSEARFFEVPQILHGDDPNWIPVIRNDVARVFDPAKNPYFGHGAAVRWILEDREGNLIGRIAAFVNFHKMEEGNDRLGGLGFFECINNQEAAFLLFDTAVQWLVENHQVNVIEGPINFGENDKYWGLLIKGFGPVSFGMNYNPPYYVNLFESYGFRIEYRQITNVFDLHDPLPPRFARIAERIISNPKYSFRPYRNAEKDKFIRDFTEVYNAAWASFRNFHPMEEAVVRKSMEEMRPVMEEDFIWFAYAEGKPVGFIVGVPDVNDIIRYSGAEFNFWGKLKFVFYKWLKGFSTVRVVVMGIVPEYQRHGLESALIYKGFNVGKAKTNYRQVQLAWVGDFNEKMIAIHKAMEAKEFKQHATFRKVLS